jgi:hypothetical protein
MSKCCDGIFVPFVNVNCLAVTAHKPLIAKNTQLAPRSLNHIAGQCSETLQSTGFVEINHYYRPAGLPRERQPWLASVWRRSDHRF